MSKTGLATFIGGSLDLTRKPIDWPPPATYFAQVIFVSRLPEFRERVEVGIENAAHWQDEYTLLAATEDRKVVYGPRRSVQSWAIGNQAIYLFIAHRRG